MKMNFYTVYDAAINAYTRPFPMQTDGQAMRSFKDQAADTDSPVGQHPEDFSLFRVGSFDDATGEVQGTNTPICLARAHELEGVK